MDFSGMETDKGSLTDMILLDLQKAFDTVNHMIVIEILKALGVNISALNCFTSIYQIENNFFRKQTFQGFPQVLD